MPIRSVVGGGGAKAQGKVRVLCWTNRAGRKPVKDWIGQLDDQSFRKVDKLLGLLREMGRELRPPHCRFLGEGLYELRDTNAGPGYRVYYIWQGNLLIILLAAGDKGSQWQDIEVARRRMEEQE